MNKFRVLFYFLVSSSISGLVSSETIDEVVVTSALTSTNIEKPLHVLSGEDISTSPLSLIHI